MPSFRKLNLRMSFENMLFQIMYTCTYVLYRFPILHHVSKMEALGCTCFESCIRETMGVIIPLFRLDSDVLHNYVLHQNTILPTQRQIPFTHKIVNML